MNRYARALSLSRPWTELVLRHGKPVENRLWRTQYRGELIIQAAQSLDYSALRFAREQGVAESIVQSLVDAPVGYVGVVRVVGIHRGPDPYALIDAPCDCGGWGFPDQWHWELEDPRPFPAPQPGRGRVGIFDPPTAVVDYARLIGVL